MKATHVSTNIFLRKPSLTEKGEQFFYCNLFILGLPLVLDLIFLLNLTINIYCCSRKVFHSSEYSNIRLFTTYEFFIKNVFNYINRFVLKTQYLFLSTQITSWIVYFFCFQKPGFSLKEHLRIGSANNIKGFQ